jgi:hypothetical protein
MDLMEGERSGRVRESERESEREREITRAADHPSSTEKRRI